MPFVLVLHFVDVQQCLTLVFAAAMEETLFHHELGMDMASTTIRLAWHHGHTDLAKKGLQILKQKVKSPPDLGHLHLLSLVGYKFHHCLSLSFPHSQL